MALPFFSRSKNPVLERCRDDYLTKMRLKYAPYYHALGVPHGTTLPYEGHDVIMLSSNDYLGLSTHPKVIEAARNATLEWGTSTTGARSSNGSRTFHLELEERLAAFLEREACHVHSAGYLSCLTCLATFPQKGDVVFADKNLHSCMWDGLRLSHATVERFSHNNPDDLREVAAATHSPAPKILALEGVYSMEGHTCRLPELLAIGEPHGCFSIVDDAHGFGVLGRQGRGTVDHFQLNDRVDIICGSLSKSLASVGGFVAGSRDLIEYLRSNSKQTIFSAAIPPGQAAAAQAALEIMQTEPWHHERLWANTRRYRAMLQDLKLDIWGSETPAIPIVLGSKERVYIFWRALLEKGVFTVMSIAPAVPAGKDLIRTAISATHTDEQMDKIHDALVYALKKL
ncbi:aminotransferase class I/II-fold pyridoxal phosphate-dependent enzyme [Horticoccus luteus]|uniref:Aminotransferase class I/II-fold pyridoxal phosphate-dependent enzyme n=1 Tax=Horticoccus luteus TaxID=2862869 RepID=A0A8F9XJV5_9BACT|nr:aminotransferase class I/II-fold pyridoxal phosphate-dependent enzyme [Horticoccus luteus]QYM77561.1 aminotransferase class I/II-fold pyridoxal phosphate-dependent enzyme [Horticoccus luteus]